MGETEFIYAHVYNVVCYLYRLFAVNVSSLYLYRSIDTVLAHLAFVCDCLLINLKSRYQLISVVR